MKVGDLIKYHGAARAPKIITVIGFCDWSGDKQWIKGLEIGSTTQRLYDVKHCEVISESR